MAREAIYTVDPKKQTNVFSFEENLWFTGPAIPTNIKRPDYGEFQRDYATVNGIVRKTFIGRTYKTPLYYIESTKIFFGFNFGYGENVAPVNTYALAQAYFLEFSKTENFDNPLRVWFYPARYESGESQANFEPYKELSGDYRYFRIFVPTSDFLFYQQPAAIISNYIFDFSISIEQVGR